jgi:hypothetical protein
MILFFDVYFADIDEKQEPKLKLKRFDTLTEAAAFANKHTSHLIQRVELDDDYSNKRVDNLCEFVHPE